MLNPIVLGAISGDGLVLKTFAAIRDYKKKTEMSKFAYTTYEEVLVRFWASPSGSEFNHTQFINEMRLIDILIIALCPLSDKFEKQYNKKVN